MQSTFKNKTVWVTGASSGIGKALCTDLSTMGAQLILSSRRLEELNDLNAELGGHHMVVPLDLSRSENFLTLTAEIFEKTEKIDMVINNGGISQRSEAWETPLDIDRKLMEVNYFGNIALTKAVLPYLKKQNKGHLVTISSLSGKFGFFERSAYAATKHALVGFYESLRLEEEKNGIVVSIVFPGLINTNISMNALTKDGKSHGTLDNKQKNGISPRECSRQILEGLKKEKMEIFPGGKEMKAILIKRLFPNLFYRLIRKQKPR